MASDGEYKPSAPKPQARKTRARTKIDVSARQEVVQKLRPLDELHEQKQLTYSAFKMLQAAHALENQRWKNFVIVMDRHADFDIEESLWTKHTFTRTEVMTKVLDFIYMHLDLIDETKTKEYRLLWAYTQVEEKTDTRILAFTNWLTTRARNAGKGDIVTFEERGGKERWIELWQVTDASPQPDEELLDYRLF